MKIFRQIEALQDLLAAALTVAGCADQDKPPEPAPGAAPAAKIVTDLSSVSSATIDPLGTSAVPQRGEGLLHSEGGDSSSPRTFGEEPGLARQAGTDANPGEQRLLNAKAAKFANFSQVILDRIFRATPTRRESRKRYPEDQVADRHQARDNYQVRSWMRNGKLTELILEEQHSGRAEIDQMVIAVCKEGDLVSQPAAGSAFGRRKLQDHGPVQAHKLCTQKDEAHWSFSHVARSRDRLAARATRRRAAHAARFC